MNAASAQLEPVSAPATRAPSAAFPFASKFVDVLGSSMHYIDEGEGKPILFLHGNPASSYLWRNIIPYVQAQGRCIAVDLIGMGKSARPDIAYSYDDHARYLEAFIDALDLGDDITLVIHDWGSMLGFHWAATHSERVRAVAFMEAMVRPLSFGDLPGSLKVGMRVMRNPFLNWLLVGVGNLFLRVMLPDLTYRAMDDEVLARYRADYPTIRSRIAVRTFPMQVPFDGDPSRSYDLVTSYIDWLSKTDVPMLMFHGDDGVAIKAPEVAWLREHVHDLEVIDLGHGKHFLQETHPDRIGQELSRWFARL